MRWFSTLVVCGVLLRAATATLALISAFTPTPTPVANVRQLASSGQYGGIGDVRISDDGTVVVYYNPQAVERATTDGQSHTSIPVPTAYYACIEPRASADGEQVVMTCASGPLGYPPYESIAVYDGSAVNVIPQSFAFTSTDPDISGDGQTIVFASNADYPGATFGSPLDIYRWRGGQSERLTNATGSSYGSQISADGRRILFRRGGSLYVYDDAGGERRLVSAAIGAVQFARDGQSAVFSAPAWVPGAKLRERKELYRVQVDGPVQRLSDFVGGLDFAQFAANADASRVAVVFPDRGLGEGVLLTPAGPRALPGVPNDADSLTFDGTGRELAFTSFQDLARQKPSSFANALFVADIPLDPGPPVTPTPATVAPIFSGCPGDCDSNGAVTVDELLILVNIALGNASVSLCSTGDVSFDDQITVDEILTAVQNALGGCLASSAPLEIGLRALSAGALAAAKDQFCLAASSAGPDDPSHVYCALTRILTALDDPRLRAVAEQSGATVLGDSADLCGWHAVLPAFLQPGMPTGTQMLSALHDALAPEIDAAVAELKMLSDSARIFVLPIHLPYCMDRDSIAPHIVIDRGDALTVAAVLETVRATLELLTAYNFDLSLSDLLHATPEDLLVQNPALLSLTSAASLHTAQEQFAAAFSDFSAGIGAVLGETGDQSHDLFVIAPVDRASAERTAHIFDVLHDALYGQVVLGSDVGLAQPAHLDLSPLFGGQFDSLRPFLPAFDSQGGFSSQLPNPTFSGMAPELTQEAIAAALPQVRRFLLHFGRDDCGYNVTAADQTECTALQTQYQCRWSYLPFHSTSCSLYGCPCTF